MRIVQLDLVFCEAANMMFKYVTTTFAANPQFSTERAIQRQLWIEVDKSTSDV